jgi:hypothetical protein
MTDNDKSQQMLSDPELVGRIDGLVREEKHLEAARLLRNIKDPSIMSDMHRKLLDKVRIIEYVHISSSLAK